MRRPGFKTNDPLTECIGMSNLNELVKKDEEYTLKAQKEGKPYYKWNTELMTLMIYQNGIDDNNELPGVWGFISHWLALTLKFEEDEKIQYYMQEFYAGRIHYLDEYYGKTIYRHMYSGPSTYVYTIYKVYLESKQTKPTLAPVFPDYIWKLVSYYITMGGRTLRNKIPSENGLSLVEVGYEEAEKYNGLWISPEEKKRMSKEVDEILEELFKQRGIKND